MHHGFTPHSEMKFGRPRSVESQLDVMHVPASPQSAADLQMTRLTKEPTGAQSVCRGALAPWRQVSPVAQSAGSSHSMVHSPGQLAGDPDFAMHVG